MLLVVGTKVLLFQISVLGGWPEISYVMLYWELVIVLALGIDDEW